MRALRSWSSRPLDRTSSRRDRRGGGEAELDRPLARPASADAADAATRRDALCELCRRTSAIRGRAGGRQPVLPRGAHRRARRQRRARRVGRDWVLGEPEGDSPMPDTVHAVLAARIDRLPRARRRPCRRARSSGGSSRRRRWSTCSTATSRTSRCSRSATSSSPCAAPLVAGDDREFAIKHALTREVAYGSIPKARRGRLHADLADWLEEGPLDERSGSGVPLRRGGERGGRRPRVGGRPEELGRVRERAVHWLSRAGGSREVDTRWRRRSSCSRARRALRRRARAGAAVACDRGGARACATTARGCERRCCARRGPTRRRRAGGHVCAFLAFQSSIRSAMWSIRLNMELIDEWAPGPRARRRRKRGEARALLARANIELVGAPEEVLDEAASDRRRARQPRAALVRAGGEDAGRVRPAALPGSGRWSEERLALLPGIDDPDHLCEAYEAGSPAAPPSAASTRPRRLAELHGGLSQRLSRTIAFTRSRSSSSSRTRWETGPSSRRRRIAHWPRSRRTSRRPACAIRATSSCCGLAHLCLGDESRAGARAGRAANRGEGYETYLSGASSASRWSAAIAAPRSRSSSSRSSVRSSGGRASSRPGSTRSLRSGA